MAALFEPVGPLGPRVYWRRRAVVIGVVLVLLFLLLRACTGDDSGGDAGATGATSSPSATASKTPKASSSASPKASASASASATRSATPVATCKDSEVSVTARPARASYAVGDTVSITYVVATKGGVTCKRDVGGAANEVRVVQNGGIIWSSDYCSPGGEKDIRTLGPDASFSVIVNWDGDVTPSSCPDDRLPAPAGDYQVQGRNGGVLGPAAALTLG